MQSVLKKKRQTINEAFDLLLKNDQEWKVFYSNYYDPEFFSGMGVYFKCTDEEFGMEWLKRKVNAMKRKLQNNTDSNGFDVFEEDLFVQILSWIKSYKKTELEIREDDMNLYFLHFDYFLYFRDGLKSGLLKLKSSEGEKMGYGAEYVSRMFAEINLKELVQ